MKHRIASIVLTFLAGVMLVGAPPAHATGDKPNIVLIMVDDLGYGDLSSYGAPDMQTPHIDALMASGLRFDQFYANCTVCSPTRASLMTGLYPDKAGVPGVIRQYAAGDWGFLNPDAVTLPDMLRTAGYHTALVGKWHLGLESPNLPNERGFDFFHGFLGDMMNDYYTHLRGGKNWMRRNNEAVKAKGHATDVFSEWSIDYINEQAADKDKPFFLFLSYNAPHFPIQPPKDWLDKVNARDIDLEPKRAKNVAFIEHLDDNVGRVIKAIEDAGIKDNTLVIFTSDNGGSIPHAQRNLPLNGGKQDHLEGGIRVPTCVVWPGKVKPGKSNGLGITMDFYPTLCEIAGVEIDHDIDGQSLAPVWLSGEAGDPDRVLIWVRREGNNRYQGRAYYAIRRGKWKLLQNTPFEPMQLVDLEADPYEQSPMPAKGEVASELTALLMKHIQEAGRVPWQRDE
ncbi:MAG: sulfatase-like hydrolase/transferase [Phycisphaeraceae bacterium]|nr:sulfatase-like hydrolase/transferase [Phycisphaeraceae bacterium]